LGRGPLIQADRRADFRRDEGRDENCRPGEPGNLLAPNERLGPALGKGRLNRPSLSVAVRGRHPGRPAARCTAARCPRVFKRLIEGRGLPHKVAAAGPDDTRRPRTRTRRIVAPLRARGAKVFANRRSAGVRVQAFAHHGAVGTPQPPRDLRRRA